MLLLKTILSAGVLVQLAAPKVTQPAEAKHPAVTRATKVRTPAASESVFQSLLRMGIRDHVPMGIVVGLDRAICRAAFPPEPKIANLADLIDAMHRELPGYRTAIANGILNIEPKELSRESADFLNLRLPEFRTPRETLVEQGFALWMFALAVIAPEKGAAFAGGISVASETMPAVSTADKDVRTTLNMLIDQRSGGVWMIDETNIDKVPPDMGDPVEMYGYVGNESVIEMSQACPVK